MKFYIATSLSRVPVHNQVRDVLANFGFTLTYDWTLHGNVKNTTTETLRSVGQKELRGILNSDFVVVLLPGGKGTHTELGAALAANKRVYIHSDNPFDFMPCERTCAFYHHHLVTHSSSSLQNLSNFIDIIKSDLEPSQTSL